MANPAQFTFGYATQPDARLVCLLCGHGHQLADGDVGKHIRSGWPQCCGQEMRLEIGRVPTSALVPLAA